MKELLHFTATWCQPCKQMAPVIDKFINDNPDVVYTKIDAEQSPSVFSEYKITGVPAFISKINGQEYKFHKGIASEDKIIELFT